MTESVFKLSSHDESSGQLMTRTNTASPDHTSRISPLTSPSYHVQRLTRCLHCQIFKVAWGTWAFSPCFLYLAPHGYWRQEEGSRSSTPAIPLFSAFSSPFPFVPPSIHQSIELTKSCMDFLSFIFWNKNMIMIIVQTEPTRCGRWRASTLIHEEREPFNHCRRPYKNIASNMYEIWRTRTFKLQALYEIKQRKSAWNVRRNEDKSPELQFFVTVLAIAWKHQTANVSLHLNPAAEDLVVQSILATGWLIRW